MRFVFIFFINLVYVKSDWVFCKHEVREIGDPCATVTTNKNGICKLAADCISAFHNPFVRPSLCGFAGHTPIVCCPKEQMQRIGDSCLVEKTNTYGICKAAANCNSGFGKHDEQLCAYLLFMPVVCCPIKDQLSLVTNLENFDKGITKESTDINKTFVQLTKKSIDLVVNINIEL